ncbi:hypothetical protein HPB52_004746 [Rhipicephalus sanguineus]|uniref:Tick transposon n=1 Tax=Rhipicephalus sanguineus TaxID=34632 RepID=A0A9D4SVP0_RHISA|nr:hypothetical protein HPB52_004746 [Rhipicephalus sanguineus]
MWSRFNVNFPRTANRKQHNACINRLSLKSGIERHHPQLCESIRHGSTILQVANGACRARPTEVHETSSFPEATRLAPCARATRRTFVIRDPHTPRAAGISQVKWTRLEETLGSDHHLVQTEIIYKRAPVKIGKAKITDWTAFRKEELTRSIEGLEEWTKLTTEKTQKYTKEMQLTLEKPAADPHLLHLWEARRSLIRRRKKQKRNRVLKKRIAELTRQADKYADELARHNWNQMCDRLQGTLGTRKTWNILKSMLSTTESKTNSRKNLAKLIHNYGGLGK